MKIAIGGFFHESNTFNPIICGEEDFVVFKKDEIYANRNSYLIAKGIIEFFEKKTEYQIIPLVFAKAVPNGEISEDFYNYLKALFFEYLSQSPQIDAFVLALHGSMRVKNIGSAESDLLKAIKTLYPETPIFVALDMHATLTLDMLSNAEAFTGFKTAPHLDAYETGFKAAEMADIALSNKSKLCFAYHKLACLIAGEKSETDCEPMKSLIAETKKIEMDPEVCSASYLLGFPWADAEENGVTTLVVTKSDKKKAQYYADYLAEQFLKHKSDFSFSSPAYPAYEALSLALNDNCKPVFVSDSGDNPTAGSTGDNTHIVKLLSTELKEKCYNKQLLVAGIFDPKAVDLCMNNLHQQIRISVGGVFDTKYCQPQYLEGKPIKIVKNFGLFKSILVLFKTETFDLIITSKHIGFTNVDMFQALEIDYLKKDIIVVKLGYLTEDFKDLAAKSYLALTQGCTDEVLSRLSYHKSYDLI